MLSRCLFSLFLKAQTLLDIMPLKTARGWGGHVGTAERRKNAPGKGFSVSPQAWLGGSLQRFHLEGQEDSVVLLGFIDVGSASRITLVGHPCLQTSDRRPVLWSVLSMHCLRTPICSLSLSAPNVEIRAQWSHKERAITTFSLASSPVMKYCNHTPGGGATVALCAHT